MTKIDQQRIDRMIEEILDYEEENLKDTQIADTTKIGKIKNIIERLADENKFD